MSTATVTATGSAELGGTARRPHLLVRFPWGATHARFTALPLTDWAKSLPGRRWNPDMSAWEVTSLGERPDEKLREAGIEFEMPEHAVRAGITRLQDLYTPLTELEENERTVLVYPRFAGFEGANTLIGGAGVWVRELECIRMPVADVVLGASPRPGVVWDPRAVEIAHRVQAASPLLHPELAEPAALLASAVDITAPVAAAAQRIQTHLGGPVGSFGIALYPYQKVGAYGVAAGHRLLADSPGVGKTFTSLATVAALRAERILVIAPPVVLTNWKRETVKSGLASEDEVAVFYSGRKAPTLDTAKAVVISDSMLASRPATTFELSRWLGAAGERGAVIYDEAHRMKTMGSQRSEAVLNLLARAPEARRIALTGTPVLAGPHELIPVLEFTGHLAPVFGGAGPFLEAYCVRDRFGRFHPRKRALTALHQMLDQHVWVRRTKTEVLPQLPSRTIAPVVLDVPLTEYRKTHREVYEEVKKWVEQFRTKFGRDPDESERDQFAQENLRFVSQLRRAAGLAKVDFAAEMVADHLRDDPTRPLILWTHHVDVTAAMAEAARKAGVEVGVIAGSTPDKEKNALVDAFQRGELPVLVCSITAAGVGITLTRSSDVLFVESDWTPALMLQAIDRVHRIGQKNAISVQILLARGTLDEHMQARLAAKGDTLEKVLGDDSNSVAVTLGDDAALMHPKDILLGMLDDALRGVK